MMVPTRASWQPSTFGIDDHEVLWTQTTEDDCFEQSLRWQYHLIIRLCCFWLSDHSIIWSLDHSIIGSSTIRSSDWLVGCSIIRSSKHSIMRSLDHSIIGSLDPLKADYSRLELTVANWLLQTQRLTLAEWLHLVFELFNEHLIQ